MIYGHIQRHYRETWQLRMAYISSGSTYPLPYYTVLLLIHHFTLWPWPFTIGVARGCTRAVKKILGRNLLGKVVSAPSGRARVQFLGQFLLGGEDLEGWGVVNLVVVACVLRATTKKEKVHPRLCFDLWPWTFAVYGLWRDGTLYQIWTQSNNPLRSHCDYNIWPNDLEHVLLCCARLWDNFLQVWPSTTYQCLNYSVFWCGYVVTL